jgi:hypothetical protein
LIDELSGPRQHARRVVVVEDAHWADEATLDMLVFLGRRIDRLHAMLIVTYRDDELNAEHPLRAALAALPRPVLRLVHLAPLSRECVAEQALRAGRDRGDLYELTGGNRCWYWPGRGRPYPSGHRTGPHSGAAAPAVPSGP